MTMIDTHCHLYAEEFKEDIIEVINQAKAIGVNKFLLPAIDSSSLESMLKLEEEYPNECFAMIGLHPCYAKENYESELVIVQSQLEKRKFIAIGEIGLDYYWDKTFINEQKIAFNLQMEWALFKDYPIVIHTRNAMQETIEMVKPFAKKGLKGVFHCFSGSIESARQIISMEFLLGIGGVITYKNSGLVDTIKEVPLDFLLLETDAPYLPPVPFRGKRNESSYLKYIVTKIAEIKEIKDESVAMQTTINAEKLFFQHN